MIYNEGMLNKAYHNKGSVVKLPYMAKPGTMLTVYTVMERYTRL